MMEGRYDYWELKENVCFALRILKKISIISRWFAFYVRSLQKLFNGICLYFANNQLVI